MISYLTEERKLSNLPGLGFWKLYDRLRRVGHPWNRGYRIYRELQLHQRARRKKRVPTSQIWSADLMSDVLYRGSRFRTFNVLEDFNRETLAIEIDTSLTSGRLVRVFEQLAEQRPLPAMLRTDNGPEFLGAEFTKWCKAHGVVIDYIEPGKPNQNAYIERFNRSYWTEVLSVYLFSSLNEVREITWRWMLEYNEERGHDALGKMTPIEFYNNAKVSTFELST